MRLGMLSDEIESVPCTCTSCCRKDKDYTAFQYFKGGQRKVEIFGGTDISGGPNIT